MHNHGFADRCVTTPPRGPAHPITSYLQAVKQSPRHRPGHHSECLTVAHSEESLTDDLEAKRLMLNVAADYEKLAKRAEKRSAGVTRS
jgi:hypothetical protein